MLLSMAESNTTSEISPNKQQTGSGQVLCFSGCSVLQEGTRSLRDREVRPGSRCHDGHASCAVAMVISLTDQMLFQEVQLSPQELVSHLHFFFCPRVHPNTFPASPEPFWMIDCVLE